jgi:iron complex transport system permease protein
VQLLLNRWLLILILVIATGISAVICIAIGPSGIPVLGGMDADMTSLILTEIRLPRVIVALLVGAGLAAAGTAMQGLFKNPLADPYVIGTSSGAALGAAISFIFLNSTMLPYLAFSGACLATIIVYLAGQRNGRIPVETLLLAGIAISLFCSAMLSFLIYISGENLHMIMFWLMGGLSNASWDSVMTGLLIIPGIIAFIILSREIDILSLGEDEASTLGVNTEHIKIVLLAISAFITGIAVSIAGTIGFIGLITPHIVRTFTGPGHRFLLPTVMLTGGLILLWADTASRSLFNDMPVGIITACLGAPFFLYLIRRRTRV